MVARRSSMHSLWSRLFDIGNIGLLLFFAVITLYPFYYVAIISISDGRYVVIGAIKHIPRGINFKSYGVVLSNPIVPISYKNTIIYTTLGTAINVMLSAFCAYYMIIMRTFFQGIPDSIQDSARIDGANDIRIFFRIILPMSTPVLATTAVLNLNLVVHHVHHFLAIRRLILGESP